MNTFAWLIGALSCFPLFKTYERDIFFVTRGGVSHRVRLPSLYGFFEQIRYAESWQCFGTLERPTIQSRNPECIWNPSIFLTQQATFGRKNKNQQFWLSNAQDLMEASPNQQFLFFKTFSFYFHCSKNSSIWRDVFFKWTSLCTCVRSRHKD